jgi:ferrochelatase
LLEISRQQAEMLRARIGVPVYLAMRNWKPYVGEVVAQMLAENIARAVVICLAPHNSRTSVGLYRRAVESAAAGKMAIDFVESWHDNPLLIRAFAEKLQPALTHLSSKSAEKVGHPRRDSHPSPKSGERVGHPGIIFTAHSVPARTVEKGDPYEKQAQETAALVAAQIPSLAREQWKFAFQSQGKSGGEWLRPTVEETMLAFKTAGARRILLQPIGFLCDHVEVLYDIDIAFQRFAREHGLELERTESLNASPTLAGALADLAQSRLSGVKHSAHMPMTAKPVA